MSNSLFSTTSLTHKRLTVHQQWTISSSFWSSEETGVCFPLIGWWTPRKILLVSVRTLSWRQRDHATGGTPWGLLVCGHAPSYLSSFQKVSLARDSFLVCQVSLRICRLAKVVWGGERHSRSLLRQHHLDGACLKNSYPQTCYELQRDKRHILWK